MAAPAHAPDFPPAAPPETPSPLLGAGSNAGAAAIAEADDRKVRHAAGAMGAALILGSPHPVDLDICRDAMRDVEPQRRFIRFRDNRTGHEWLAVFEPGSDWHELLPDEQTVLIHTREDLPRTE
jgi:hypothetical protein